jgi:hypothetical protein
LITLYLVGAKNTECWCTRKGDLQCAFPLDILMVPSSALAVIADGERLSCDVFSLREAIVLGVLRRPEPLFYGGWFRCRCHGLDPRRDTIIAMGHDRDFERSSTRLWMEKGGSISPLPEGMAPGLQPPLPQPYCVQRPLGPLKP